MMDVASTRFCARTEAVARCMARAKSLFMMSSSIGAAALSDPVGERRLDLGARLERAEHGDGADRRAGEIGAHVGGDPRKPNDLDVQCLARLRTASRSAAL